MLLRYIRFSMAISSISYSIHKICNDEMKKIGMKGSFVQYLAAMDRDCENGVTAAKLCELCDLDKAAVSRAVSEMEKNGLVTKEEDGGKMYRIRWFLTERGKKVTRHVKDRIKTAVEQANLGLSEENRRVFVESLQMITNNLLSISENGLPQGNIK